MHKNHQNLRDHHHLHQSFNLKRQHITDVPSPKIKALNQALKGHVKSYGIELQDDLNPLNHFTKTKVLVESHLEDQLKTMKGFKFNIYRTRTKHV